MTLVVIAVVTILLTAYARLTLTSATEVGRQERHLQFKWGMASCSRLLLNSQPLGSAVDNDSADRRGGGGNTPAAYAETIYVLGGQTFYLSLEDEASKLDVNLLLRALPPSVARETVQAFLPEGELMVRLSPLPEELQRDLKEDAVESFGQVFSRVGGSAPAPDDIRRAARRLTCWGGGVNIRTADDQVLFESCKVVVGPIWARRVVDARRSNSEMSASELVSSIAPPERQASVLNALLLDRSPCHSLWVEVRDGPRRQFALMVRKQYTATIHRIHSFTW